MRPNRTVDRMMGTPALSANCPSGSPGTMNERTSKIRPISKKMPRWGCESLIQADIEFEAAEPTR